MSMQGPFLHRASNRQFWWSPSAQCYIFDDGTQVPIGSAPTTISPRSGISPNISSSGEATVSSTYNALPLTFRPNHTSPSPAERPRFYPSSRSLPDQTVASVGPGFQYTTAPGPAGQVSPQSRQTVVSGPAKPSFEGDTSRLYPEFKHHSSNFFKLGKVFTILWVEPSRSEHSSLSGQQDPSIIPGRYSESVHSKLRRFIVIREGVSYCSALPITSYGQQGVSKKGVVKSEHAIVYTGKTAPQPLKAESPAREEEPMLGSPIRVLPDDKTDGLDPASRLDFGKVHTIQHNIKAKSFGMVHDKSKRDLVNQFTRAWNRSFSSNPHPPEEPLHSNAAGPSSRASGSRRENPRYENVRGGGVSSSKGKGAQYRSQKPVAESDPDEEDKEEDEVDDDIDDDEDEDEDEDEDDDDDE